MKASTIAIITAVFLVVLASFLSGWNLARRRYEMPSNRPDTVTIEMWHHDTIPAPHDSVVVKIRTVYLPVHDTTTICDTLHKTDSILVDVPITERLYIADDYRATVRGFQPELVDIWVKQKETTITVPYRKRWSITVGPQVGYGFTPKGWQPYAGGGITFGYSF